MSIIAFKGFKGEIPRSEPHLLPDANAQLARDCEFDSGALTPVKAGFELATMANNPAKGVYTEDGLLFYSWPVETIVFPSPLAEDTFNRIYYLSPSVGQIRVVSKLGMTGGGPTPTGSVRAGVPNPIVTPVLTLRDRSTLPDYPTIAITAETWWIDRATGNTVNRAAATVTPQIALRGYRVAKPSASGKPAVALMGSKLVFTDTGTGKEIFSLTTTVNSITKSAAVPGTVEGLLAEDSTSGLWYLTWGVMESRAYTYGYENTWNERGGVAPPAVVSPTYVQDVQVDTTPPDFTDFRPMLKTVIYRTYGTSATYIDTFATQDGSVSTRFYDGSTKPSTVGLALASAEYLPPGVGMSTFEMMPNGWCAGSIKNTLWMSEPSQPHAWPYSIIFNAAIRGIRGTQSGLIVTTADGVYYVGGITPVGARATKVALPQPGIAQRSMVQIDGAVAYASNDGIAMVTAGQGTMELSQKLFYRKKWREFYDTQLKNASFMFGYHDGMLIAHSNAQEVGFSVRLDDDAGAFTRNDRHYDAMIQLPVLDALYYTLGNKLYQYRGSPDNIAFDWWSKDFIYLQDNTFGAGFIDCDGAITLMLYADGALVATETVNNGYFRFADMDEAKRWSVRLQGSSRVRRLFLARTKSELKKI